jgi:hypothetical protein
MSAASLLPIGGAEAMTAGSASGVRGALAATDLTQSVARCYRPCPGCALVCRRGYRGYYGGYYGPYAYPYGYPYGGYYGPGVGIYGPGVGIGIGIGPRWGW